MKDYFKLLKFARNHLGYLILAFFCMGISTLFDGVTLGMIVPITDKILTDKKIILPAGAPSFLSELVNKINSIPAYSLLKIMAVFILFLFFLKGLFQFFQGFMMNVVAQRSVRDARNKIFVKLQELSLDFYSQKRMGELISRLTNDAGLIGQALSYGLTDLIYQSMQVILFSSLALFINFKLALISFLVFPLISFPIFKIGKKLKKLSLASQERMADINSILSEVISGVKIIKGFNLQENQVSKFKNINQSYCKFILKAIRRTLILAPSTQFIGALAAIFILVVGGKEVIEGRLSFGVFGLFLGSLMSIIRPFKKLSQVHAINQQALAASSRIYEILNKEPSVKEEKGAFLIKSLNREIRFEQVWFKYTPSEDYILKNINIKVKVGEVIAIVGPSGGGKTTLLNLIPRFYDPTKGRILFDNVDIRRVKLKSLRDLIGIVTQEPILFNDTVKANIAYGKPSASSKEIKEAARKALAYDFIERLPQGFFTFIGDRGFRLSGGEKQRICIARAILKDPCILLLDEATSQLDSESERLVQQALENLTKARTAFVIAHRLSTVKSASRILVMDKGQIIAEGYHEKLLKECALYRHLYEIQFGLYRV